MPTTEDPNDPRLTHGVDSSPVPQAPVYLVMPRGFGKQALSEEERRKQFVRPVRRKYIHKVCGGVTRMGLDLAETYARQPDFYGSTYCVHCKMHRPVSEFLWDGTDEEVGS